VPARAKAAPAAARAQVLAARLIGALPAPAKRRLVGAPIRRDGLELDLDMQVLVKLAERDLHSLTGRTPQEAREDLREAVRPLEGARIAVDQVRDTQIQGATGPLRARLYCPDTDGGPAAPLVVYYHGGGWVAGDLDTHDQPCRLLAKSPAHAC
jgi:acetyl esterase